MNRTGKPINITKYPLVLQAYTMCRWIETLPASSKQTALVIKAGELMDECWNYYEEKKKSPEPEKGCIFTEEESAEVYEKRYYE